VGLISGLDTSLKTNILTLSGIELRFFGLRKSILIPILAESFRLVELD